MFRTAPIDRVLTAGTHDVRRVRTCGPMFYSRGRAGISDNGRVRPVLPLGVRVAARREVSADVRKAGRRRGFIFWIHGPHWKQFVTHISSHIQWIFYFIFNLHVID